MPISTPVATGSMIVGTVLTAAGLNLGVLRLDQPATMADSTGETEIAAVAAPAPAEFGAMTAARVEWRLEGPVDDDAEHDDHSGTPYNGDNHEEDDGEDGDLGHEGLGDHQIALETEVTASTSLGSVASTTRSSAPAPTGPAPTAPSTTARPIPTSPTTRPASAAAPPTAPLQTQYLRYEFDGVASIIVALHDGSRLEFWSAIPEDGWAFSVEDDLPHEVVIEFRPVDGGDEAEFEVELDGGELKVTQEY